MRNIFILMLCSLASFVACVGTTSGGVVKKKYAQYSVEPLGDGWQQKRFRGADLFFEHKKGGATIFLSSQCEKISDSPLEALTAQMLVGLSKVEILSQKSIFSSGREGLVSEVSAKIDGVPRYLKIMVLKKNRCVFDAVFSATGFSNELSKDFDKMIESFNAEADL